VGLAAQAAVGHFQLAHIIFPIDVNHATDFRDDRFALGGARLEEFLDARQTLRDVLCTRNAAGVESAQGELRTWLTDGLCCNDAYSLTHLHRSTACQVATIAQLAKPEAILAGQRRAHVHFVDTSSLDHAQGQLIKQLVSADKDLASPWIGDRGRSHPAHNAFLKFLTGFLGACLREPDAGLRPTVIRGDNDVLGHVDEAACQVASICRAQGGVGKTFACAMRAQEVLERGEAFTEVRPNRQRDNPPRRISHQTAHAGQLADRLDAAFGRTRRSHRAQPGERIQQPLHRLRDLVGRARP